MISIKHFTKVDFEISSTSWAFLEWLVLKTRQSLPIQMPNFIAQTKHVYYLVLSTCLYNIKGYIYV